VISDCESQKNKSRQNRDSGGLLLLPRISYQGFRCWRFIIAYHVNQYLSRGDYITC